MTRPARRRRAPTTDGEAYIDPPLSQAVEVVASNRELAASWDSGSGVPLGEWRQQGRRNLIDTASIGHSTKVEATRVAQQPLVLSGHQPELFHSGVWFKNFLLDGIARRMNGVGINLVIDNDVARLTSVRVPVEAGNAASVIEIPFDASTQPMPWEERRIADVPFFSSFAGRVHAALGGQLHHRSLVLDQLWPHAVTYISHNLRHPFSDEPASAALARCRLGLGETLARARHAVEREAGLTTREHPLGLACWFDPFKPFAAHLFSRAVEFHHVYNQALAEYRAASHVRSKTHPVPDLVRKGEWLEMPFWMWTEPDRTDNHPQRQRVFVRARGKSWELWDGGHLHVSPAATPWTKGVYQWDELGTKLAHKLRPRALITTMYARLVLSDLFIHGIGGAKYDEVTDEIIRRFFGIEPPKYITATATFRLPIERPHVTIEDVRDVRQKLREVRYRPETFLRDPLTRQVAGLREQLQALADEKREYVRTHSLRRCEEAVYARLEKLNRAMHDLLQPVERELLAQQAQLSEDLRRAELLGSREFSFVLFPADELPRRLLALSKVSA